VLRPDSLEHLGLPEETFGIVDNEDESIAVVAIAVIVNVLAKLGRDLIFSNHRPGQLATDYRSAFRQDEIGPGIGGIGRGTRLNPYIVGL
jgi:hypothetical protein